MRSITATVAERALATRYDDLPDDVITLVKRCILDSIACMYGAIDSETARATGAALPLIGGSDEATLVARPERTSTLGAVIHNGALLRYLDYNDVQDSNFAPGPRHGHNSEFIPLVLALAEREGIDGAEVISAISLAFDLATGFTDSIVGDSLETRGWNMDLRGFFVAPLLAGRLLGLSIEQSTDAVGIALSRGALFGILDSSTEPNTMAKNLRMPLTVHTGLLAAYLAANGMSGPPRALDGEGGFAVSLLRGDFDPSRVEDSVQSHRIREAALKFHAACYSTHGHLTATLALVAAHGITPDMVASVRIRTTTRGARHTGDPARAHPTNKETADHSSQYLTAVAIAHGVVGPSQFAPEVLADPEIHKLIDKVEVIGAAEFDAVYPSAETTIRLTSRDEVSHRVARPLGHPENPMSDREVLEKLRNCAGAVLTEDEIGEIYRCVVTLDEPGSFHALMTTLSGHRRR